MSDIDTAKQIATEAHYGQTRWGGEPYITHPEAVVQILTKQNMPEEVLIVGWLHDVVEDTPVTLTDLIDDGFNQDIVDAVNALTHRINETYADYISRISLNPMATTVKLADLSHNLEGLTQKQRRDKYELASLFLHYARAIKGRSY